MELNISKKHFAFPFFSAQSTFTYTIVYVIFKAFYLVVHNILPYLCCELIYIFLKFKCFSLFFCLLFHLSTLALLACLLAGCMGKVHRNSVFLLLPDSFCSAPFCRSRRPPRKKKERSDEKYKFHIYFWFSN